MNDPGWRWDELPPALAYAFSPDGRALALRPLLAPNSIEVLFAEGREALRFTFPQRVGELIWVTPDELACQVMEDDRLHLCDLRDGTSRPALSLAQQVRSPLELAPGSSLATFPAPGQLSYLGDREGVEGLFRLDLHIPEARHLPFFDGFQRQCEVYPLFGHVWSPDGRWVAVTAWPGDLLEPGVEPTQANSHWSPILDDPSIQSLPVIKQDGSRVTQREMSQEAKQQKPPRLFLVSTTGDWRELPESSHARAPCWSPDGSLLSFRRYQSPNLGLWALDPTNLAVQRLGTTSPAYREVMHPDGHLYCWLEDEDAPASRHKRPPGRWHRLCLKAGQVTAEP